MLKNRKYIPVVIFLWALLPLYLFAANSFNKPVPVADIFVRPIVDFFRYGMFSYFTGTALLIPEAFITLIVLNFAAYFLGCAFFRLTKIDIESCTLKRLYKIATGFGIIFITLLILGLAGLYTTIPLSIYIILLICACAVGVVWYIRDFPREDAPDFSAVQKLLVGLTLFVIFLDLIIVLTPPIARDALIHHLAKTKIYLKEGGLVPIEYMRYVYRSLNIELLYTLALFLKNDILAKVMHFNFYLLSIIALYYTLRVAFTRTLALVSVLLFASIPVVFNTASFAYVDIGLVFFGIMLLNAAVRYIKTRESAYLLLAGIMSGLCASTKINGYLFVLLIFLWIATVAHFKKFDRGKFIAGIALFFLFAFIFDAHFLLKNTLHSGDPFYPVISSVIKGSDMATEDGATKLLRIEIRRALYQHTMVDELLMPWVISTAVESRAFYTVDGALGPMFLIFLPFIFLVRKNRLENLTLLAVAGAYLTVCWWFWAVRLRYLIIIFPIGLYLLCAVVEELFDNRDKRGKWLFAALVSALLFLNLFHISDYMNIVSPFEFLSGTTSREDYIEKQYPQYKIFRFINEEVTDENALIYFLDFGNFGYYCDADYIYDMPPFLGRSFRQIARGAKNAADISMGLKKRGITHLLINTEMFDMSITDRDYYSEEEFRITKEFIESRLIMLKMIGKEAFFKIRYDVD